MLQGFCSAKDVFDPAHFEVLNGECSSGKAEYKDKDVWIPILVPFLPFTLHRSRFTAHSSLLLHCGDRFQLYIESIMQARGGHDAAGRLMFA
jgi:hypothetical protein